MMTIAQFAGVLLLLVFFFFCNSMRSQFTFLFSNFIIAQCLGVLSFVFVPKPRGYVKVLVDRNWSIISLV